MTMLTDDREMDPAAEGAQARLSTAWHWLCEQRAGAPDTADVWDIRWQHLNTGEGWLTALEGRLLRGTYRLSPLQLYGQGAQRRAVWGAQDALVLKWVALSLQHLLPLHPSCEHVKGYGGGKPSIETLDSLLTSHTTGAESPTGAPHYRWVCRTDIRGYYRNIRKETLMQQVSQHVISPVLQDLVHQYLHYTVEDGGTFHTLEKGISRGCPLSPLMGALHLYDMDAHFSRQQGIHYARYMDDVIILATSRWSLRKQTRQLMQWFSEYGFEAHPDKTFIGRTEKGFDWMGAWLTHEGVTDIAPRAKANHREKVRRLYERLARVPFWKRKRAQRQVHARVSAYRLRWNIWAMGVLSVAACTTRPVLADTVFVSQSQQPGTEVWSYTLPGTGGQWIKAGTASSFITRPTGTQGEFVNGAEVPIFGAPTSSATARAPIPGTNLYGSRLGGSSPFYITQDPVGDDKGGSIAWNGATCTATLNPSTSPSVYGPWVMSGSFGSSATWATKTSCATPWNYRYGYLGAWKIVDTSGSVSWPATSVSYLLPTVRYAIVYAPSASDTTTTVAQGTFIYSSALCLSQDVCKPFGPQFTLPAIRLTGVACSLSLLGPSSTNITANIAGTDPAGAMSGTLDYPGVTATCTGGISSSDPVLNIGILYAPASGTSAVSGRTDAVSADTDAGHYLTINTASSSCTTSPTNLDLTGATPQAIGTVQKGGTASTYATGILHIAVCRSAQPTKTGTHSIGLTVSSTMF